MSISASFFIDFLVNDLEDPISANTRLKIVRHWFPHLCHPKVTRQKHNYSIKSYKEQGFREMLRSLAQEYQSVVFLEWEKVYVSCKEDDPMRPKMEDLTVIWVIVIHPALCTQRACLMARWGICLLGDS